MHPGCHVEEELLRRQLVIAGRKTLKSCSHVLRSSSFAILEHSVDCESHFWIHIISSFLLNTRLVHQFTQCGSQASCVLIAI